MLTLFALFAGILHENRCEGKTRFPAQLKVRPGPSGQLVAFGRSDKEEMNTDITSEELQRRAKKIAGPPAGLTGWAGNFAGILSLRFSFNKTAAALLAPSLQQALHRICPCRVGHRRVCPRRHSRCTELRAAAKMLIN